MKSVKPGRGPSMMGGIGAVLAALFGVFWTIMAAQLGAPAFFMLFGVIFVGIGIVQAVYNFKNATGKNRYSSFDIVDSREEQDPLEERFGRGIEDPPERGEARSRHADRFCPYCGRPVEGEFEFCPRCGKKLPEE